MSRAATRKRDLRTGRPVWSARRAQFPAPPPLNRDIRTEILVVGAGVSGALAAERLSAAHEVTVIDRRGPALGSTAASTALVEHEIDTPLVHLAKKIGWDRAVRAWRRSRLAVDGIAARTRALRVACDMKRRDSLYLAGTELDGAGLEAEHAARRRAGIESTLLSRKELRARFDIARAGALLAYDDLAVNPVRFALAHLRIAAARGARIRFPVEAAAIEEHRAGVSVETAGGPVIEARILIYCTGYETPKIVPAGGHRVVSTYAIATRTQRRLWPEECLIWEASDPYLYVRTTPGGRVLCGGEDEPFADEEARDALLVAKTRTLRRKLGTLLPRIDANPEFAWAGSFGVTDTGLPFIGRVPGSKRVFAVLGFGGNGMTFSRIAADTIAAELAGRPDPDADLFAFPG